MKAMKQIKEVSMTDQFFAVYDLLVALGYDTKDLTVLDMAQIRHDILKAIEGFEDPVPGAINWAEHKVEEGDLPL